MSHPATAAPPGPAPLRPDADGAGARTTAVWLAEGHAAERAGQREQARACFERALFTMRAAADAAQASATLRWIARTYLEEAEHEAAWDCLEAALAVAEAAGDGAACGHAVNIQAVVRWRQGDLDEAERLYLNARGRALQARDAKLAAMTAQNLGVLASIRGDRGVALQHYEASLSDYRALGLLRDVCVALNNLGLLHTLERRWEDAHRAFAEATEIADLAGDQSTRIVLDVNFAELWVARGEYAYAQAAVRHALDLATRTGDAAAIGQATKLQGIIARETGDLEAAELHLARAEEVAEARGDLSLLAEVSRERADLARRLGRNREVLQRLNRAHGLFERLRAARELQDIDQRFTGLRDEFLHVARRWGESIEAKDRYTQGHCVRVADLSCAIAGRAGFDEHALFWFRIGALLHDVGKIVIPGEVLNKPGKLSDEEWALMRNHTTAGVEVLADIEFPWDIRPIIQYHHERWDGAGYHGLSGEDIPLVARILCVADVYDALTSVRSYKRAMSHDDTMTLMRRDVGKAFDPTVFAWFEEVAAQWAARMREDGASAATEPDAAASEASAAAGASALVVSPSAPELDDLTGIPLRKAFRETAERVLAARRTTERPVSLLVIDIDHFKLVNDTFGHLQGDDVLRMVADQLRVNTRPTDYVARYAGDEFVAMLPGTRLEDAVAIGERVRVAVAGLACPRRDADGQFVQVTLSIGAASAPMHGEDLEALFASADSALYEAKRRGRNGVAAATAGADSGEAQLLFNCFVGRAEERTRLGRLFDEAARERPSMVAIVGEAGVGKTTLVRQLAPDVAVRAGVMLAGRCIEADVQPPYGPFAEVLAGAVAAGLVPERPWSHLRPLCPALPGGGDAPPAGDGSRFALLQELEELLTAAAAERPLVVTLEDVQWADAATWDALEYLQQRLETQRVLLCLTIRGEDMSAAGTARRRRLTRAERFAELPLARLTRDELTLWLRSIMSGQVPDEALVDHLLAHTEGNPLFAVQTVRALADDESLRHVEGRWQYTPGGDQPLPTAVEDLLSRRLDRLSDAARDVLVVGAVIGREFDAETLLEATEQDEAAVLEAIDEAMARSVLVTTPARGGSTLAFAHRLLAEVLLRGVNPLRRRRVHARVARAIEARAVGSSGEVALHYDRAGIAREAYRSAMDAGQQAAALYTFDAALDFFAMAQRHAGTLAEQADAEWRMAQVHEQAGRYVDAERHCQLVLTSLAAGASSLGVLAPARRMLQRLKLQRGVSAHEVLAACFELLEEAREREDRAEVVALLTMVSLAYGRLGDTEAAEQVARQALTEAEMGDDLRLQADAIMRVGSTLLTESPGDAVPLYRRALDLFTRLADRRGQLRCHINVGVACDRAGNHPAAEVSYATALDIARDVRSADLAGATSMNLGVLQMKSGRFAAARERFDEALRLFASIGNEPFRLVALYNLAHVTREEQNPAGALELYSACAALAATLGQRDVHLGAIAGAGLAELALGFAPSAEQQRVDVTELSTGREHWWFQGRELYDALVVKLAAVRGDRDAVETELTRALERADEHDQYAAVWLAAECAGVLRAMGLQHEDLLHRYSVHARALGYQPLVSRLRPQALVA
ncbi:diguanylate cyclase [Roseisolibacter sp. H3M3-2]|uniref:diguanylate cyclase n=1 Tax=Roseisolibacter sp. H3M3-2 TaxID=3031323 RepID=UPI0023DC2D06|nr:diguanylate cyclase [Roseisolibacter sp. H3M3-2]MDF1503709.1 diguanylate cyclase [Roseisolibacter sp. H3M3-2]